MSKPKLVTLGRTERIQDAHAFIDELQEHGYTAVLICGVRRNESGGTSFWPGVFGCIHPTEAVFACQRMIWHEMRDVEEEE